MTDLYSLDRWEFGRRWGGSGNADLDEFFELMAAEVLALPGGRGYVFTSDSIRADLSGLASEAEIDQWLDGWLPANRFRLNRSSWTSEAAGQRAAELVEAAVDQAAVDQPPVRPARRRRCAGCGQLHPADVSECPELAEIAA